MKPPHLMSSTANILQVFAALSHCATRVSWTRKSGQNGCGFRVHFVEFAYARVWCLLTASLKPLSQHPPRGTATQSESTAHPRMTLCFSSSSCDSAAGSVDGSSVLAEQAATP